MRNNIEWIEVLSSELLGDYYGKSAQSQLAGPVAGRD
jgi:hypothetical protein